MSLPLRGRLLLAFVLVAVPPLLLLAAAVTTQVSRGFEESARARLASGLSTARRHVEALRERAGEQVALVAVQDLPQADPLEAEEPDRAEGLAQSLALRRDLQAFEVVDSEGRVVMSRHWPAGFGLPDRDGLFPDDPALRLERVGAGHGVAERLALMPSHEGVWRGSRVVVRGGPFLDGPFLADLAALMGVEVGLRDLARHRWIAPRESPLVGWTGPEKRASGGRALLRGVSHEWAATPLHPALWLVVATPRTPLEALTGHVRRLSLGLAGLALVASLAAALALSGRIARPVRRLAEAARRVAAGDLGHTVRVPSGDEIGRLAGDFNAMSQALKASHARLVQAERVAAWREMARRLAHELKNPLFPIQVSIETLRRAMEQGRPDLPALLRDSSDTILEELRSLRQIVDEFSAFARMPRPRPRPVDLSEVAEQVLGLHQARAGEVRVERLYEPGLPPVLADRDLLARAVGNLVANAFEAMPEGGTLTVRTASRGSDVVLEVEDTGGGIGEAQRRNLFTPYYTTKQGGTGLGLVIAQGIVADHGGRLELHSEPGRGTCFSVALSRPSGGVVPRGVS